MKNLLHTLYHKLVLNHPARAVVVVLCMVAFFASYIPQFRLDASSDTLVLEHDQALAYYRQVKEKYGDDEYLIITYTPKMDLFTPETLDDLEQLQNKLSAVPRVQGVTTILNVPLIKSPPITLTQMAEHVPVLRDPQINMDQAREELITSTLYKDLLISTNGKTTSLLVQFEYDQQYYDLSNQHNQWRQKQKTEHLTTSEQQQAIAVDHAFKTYKEQTFERQKNEIAQIRSIMDEHRDMANLYLGGIPMITVDSLDFISKDLRVFGAGVACFLIMLLAVFFRHITWVLLPMVTCLCVGITMVGLLGLVGWPVTVVSSNFISLLLIITLSLNVHLIVRYREKHVEDPTTDHKNAIAFMVEKMAAPCFFTVTTTMVAFGSLIISDVRPVMDFGWMMVVGIAMAFMIVFTLFPSMLSLLPAPTETKHADLTTRITHFFARITHIFPRITFWAFMGIISFSIWGIQYLSVENRFIDYYKDSTEIYQGMKVIDKNLGGTTPMDIIIEAPADYMAFQTTEEDPFADETTGPDISTGYWFGGESLKQIAAIHTMLENQSSIGKVLSFHTAMQMLQTLDSQAGPDRFYLSVIYNKLPESVRTTLFDPYISADGNQLHFSARVYETDTSLNRSELLKSVQNKLENEVGLAPEQIHVSGMLVLYHNLLQSLFKSQILTLGVVFLAILGMFAVSFGSFRMALLAIVPNVVPAVFVLGFMGWANIPLDIMTITIASIAVGIGVDNTIHYVHRFMAEFKKDGNYWNAVNRSHDTIGRAMYYTSITITLGFSILILSNFIPTIYFGLLTGLSMIVALLADLMLLPVMLVLLKPLGAEK